MKTTISLINHFKYYFFLYFTAFISVLGLITIIFFFITSGKEQHLYLLRALITASNLGWLLLFIYMLFSSKKEAAVITEIKPILETEQNGEKNNVKYYNKNFLASFLVIISLILITNICLGLSIVLEEIAKYIRP